MFDLSPRAGENQGEVYEIKGQPAQRVYRQPGVYVR